MTTPSPPYRPSETASSSENEALAYESSSSDVRCHAALNVRAGERWRVYDCISVQGHPDYHEDADTGFRWRETRVEDTCCEDGRCAASRAAR